MRRFCLTAQLIDAILSRTSFPCSFPISDEYVLPTKYCPVLNQNVHSSNEPFNNGVKEGSFSGRLRQSLANAHLSNCPQHIQRLIVSTHQASKVCAHCC